MNMGFIKAACATPKIRVADCEHNANEICRLIQEVNDAGGDMAVFPELCLTGYTCGDLFGQALLLRKAKEKLLTIARFTKTMELVVIVGLPYDYEGKLYNVGAVIYKGEVLGMVPKRFIPNYSEFYEARHFQKGFKKVVYTELAGKDVPMGTDIVFRCKTMKNFTFALEICEDVWVPNPPSIDHALAGATIIANLSASNESVGKNKYRNALISGQSARLICGYVYANAGDGESTTDLVYSAHNIIAENGVVLAEARRFKNDTIYGDIDLDRLVSERKRMITFQSGKKEDYTVVEFELSAEKTESLKLERKFNPTPFVPSNIEERNKRCEEILNIQSMGLKKRLEHTGAKSAVIGISGGLDSTLALLVTVRAFDYLELDRNGIIAVTMPGFGTTNRTYDNAVSLIRILGVTVKEVPISDAVNHHFALIGHDSDNHDVTYENAQARQRTMILMDLANKYEGLVVGTGDMSELALGWATYNGDHMSMYGVNCSVPKTLVRHLVGYYAETSIQEELKKILKDILDTPVSPELLPPENGEISQKTEDLVGPYELHDFFMYYILRFGYEPRKILLVAENAFEGVYGREAILKWLKVFYRRFFSQQFKRSCLPDGPKVGSVALSPRGDLRMPSDASVRGWLEEL